MRTILLPLLAVFAATLNLSAGRLDLAVIQFPEPKTVEELEAALANVSLAEVTDADRTRTEVPYLKGGYVIFAQSFGAAPGSKFGSSTRLRNDRVDVEGKLGSGSISVSISTIVGVKAGLRSIESRVYSGEGPLPAGTARVLSIRQIKGKAPHVEKGQAKMKNYDLSTAVIAQYTP
jgi:hypothetical protein